MDRPEAIERLGIEKVREIEKRVSAQVRDQYGAGKSTSSEPDPRNVVRPRTQRERDLWAAAQEEARRKSRRARGAAALTIDEIRQMTPEQINARWSEVTEVLARSAA